MEKRNIAIDIETARKWYRSDDSSLKEFALQAYEEEELKCPWESIKTFKDAYEYLGFTTRQVNEHINHLRQTFNKKMLIAQYKLAIIKRALNDNWSPELTRGTTYCPKIKWYERCDGYREGDYLIKQFKDANSATIYNLVYSGYEYAYGGIGTFVTCGRAQLDRALTCCKSRYIAEHLGRYFGDFIFDAAYSQYGNYEFID